jgi:hypothetical protein
MSKARLIQAKPQKMFSQSVSLLTKASKLRLNLILGDQLIAKRRNEKFKRIKCSTLAKLLA